MTISCAVGKTAQLLEYELEKVASGTVMANTQNTHAAIEGLCAELKAKFDKDRAEM